MNTFLNTFEKNRVNLAFAAQQSRAWFAQQARSLNNQHITAQRLIRSQVSQNETKVIPGNLYLFQYDPKLKDTLPVWDMFPLVFPFRRLNDGFLGLNMHYLPYPIRIRLLDKLMTYRTNDALNETTRLKFSWATISHTSSMIGVRSAVHRYLGNHVKSPFKRIEASDWATAMLLPVEHFVGTNNATVWAHVR